MSLFARLILAMGLLFMATAPALAKDAGKGPRAQPFAAVLECRKVADDKARLACYDAAAGRMDEAEAKGEIVVIDKAQASQAHKEAFGLPIPSLDFITKALKPDEVDRLEGVVRTARQGADDKWTIELEGGAVWRQISGDLLRSPRQGQKVTVRKGSIGSFLMSVDGQPTIKVHRVV
jgi:hypothetical protein